jgi:hypothetical protein
MYRVAEQRHQFPLDTMRSISGGKRTLQLQQSTNAYINDNLCLSFVGGADDKSQHHLSLECEQESLQQLWIGAFRHVLANK